MPMRNALAVVIPMPFDYASMFLPNLNNGLGDAMYEGAVRDPRVPSFDRSVTETVHSEEFVDTSLFVARMQIVHAGTYAYLGITPSEIAYGIDTDRTTDDVFATLN